MAIKTLVTDSTDVRRRKWARGERKRPLRLVGSAMTTCLECGERFPDTSGGHWPGECLLVLRSKLRVLEKDMMLSRLPADVEELRAVAAGVARRSIIRDRIRRLVRQVGSHEMDGISGITWRPASIGVYPEDLP